MRGGQAVASERRHDHPFSGEHHPTAVFLAAGPAIRPRAARAQVSVLDVAPLLLYLAGQPVPNDLEGEIPLGLLDPDFVAEHPPRYVAAEALPGLPEDADAGGAQDDDAVLERLRSLGYAE